jgi:hypothetical protein
VEHITRLGEIKKLVGKDEKKGPLVRLRNAWEDVNFFLKK